MLSKKKIVAIFQLVVALLCIIAFALFTWNIRYPSDLRIHALQCALISTAIICLLFAGGTWFYTSNFKGTRYQVRIFSVAVLLIFNVILIITVFICGIVFLGKSIDGCEKDIWDKPVLIMLTLAIVLAIVVAILMILMNIFLIWQLKKKKDGGNAAQE